MPTFDLQPTLTSDLIELRPLREDDYPALYAVASDLLIWEQHHNSDRHLDEAFRACFREAMESGGALVAIDKKDCRVIGSSRYFGYNADKSEIEIGWTFLARSHWGGTYNREMKRLMLRHASQFVKNVIFVIGPTNYRCQRAVEKFGAVRVGTIEKDGRERVVYRIDASAER